ncbi:MAG: hypothetical protein ACOYUB_02715 [Patescibacteria group bacterium]
MDLFSLLGYVNKFSLLAFIATLGILAYQVYQLKKDSKSAHETPVIPDFNENSTVPKLNYSPMKTEPVKTDAKGPNSNLIILIVITAAIILLLFFTIIFKNNGENQAGVDNGEPLVKLTASKGIKVYDDGWKELTEEKIATLSSGQGIIIAIDRTSDAGIDKARIRVNQDQWKPEDENLSFDKGNNIFYKKFTVATDSAYLRIEAQLHSNKDGWLGQ